MSVTVSNSAASSNPDYSVDTTEMTGGHKQWMGLDISTDTTPSRVTASNPLPVVSGIPTTPAHDQVAVGDATAVDALAANSSRKRALLFNNTAETFYIKEGEDAVVGEGFALFPNRAYEVITTARVSVIKQTGGSLALDTFEAT